MTPENERLLNMFQENKISEEEYKLLLTALRKNTVPAKWLLVIINPFQKIAGLYSLIVGLMIIVSMSYLGVIAKVYFPGILSCLNASAMKNIKVQPNFYLLVYQNLVSWIILAVLFIIAARVFKQKGIRVIDFFGTVALSRFPYLILTVFLSIVRVVNPSLMEVDFTKGNPFQPSLMLSLFAFVVIFCIIWQIITYFYALKESSGLSGQKLWISFIAAIILGELIASPLTTLFF